MPFEVANETADEPFSSNPLSVPATVTVPSRDQQILAGLRSVKASVTVNVSDRVGNRTSGITKAFRLKAP